MELIVIAQVAYKIKVSIYLKLIGNNDRPSKKQSAHSDYFISESEYRLGYFFVQNITVIRNKSPPLCKEKKNKNQFTQEEQKCLKIKNTIYT